MSKEATATTKHWLTRPETIRKLWIISIAALAIVTALDFFLPPHPYFGIDGSFGFYSWYGFVTCAVMVVGAKLLGIFLKRKDTYYDA